MSKKTHQVDSECRKQELCFKSEPSLHSITSLEGLAREPSIDSMLVSSNERSVAAAKRLILYLSGKSFSGGPCTRENDATGAALGCGAEVGALSA